jgi:hypothetical protein
MARLEEKRQIDLMQIEFLNKQKEEAEKLLAERARLEEMKVAQQKTLFE